jgi:hypothetical protein
MLGLSMHSIDRLIRSGELKARRVGRRIFLSPDALERLLAALPQTRFRRCPGSVPRQPPNG